MRRFSSLVFAFSLLTPGCMSVPRVPADVSPEGANILSGGTFAGVLYLRSVMVLPGASAARGDARFVRCDDQVPEIRVVLHGVIGDGVTHYCETARSALDYMVAIHPRTSTHIELHLAPVGHRLSMRRWSLSARVPRLHLVAPIFSDEDRTLGNIAGLVAHEAFHLPWFIHGDEHAGDERAAYWAGVCAQLATRGKLGPDVLLADALASKDAAVVASSSAARAVRLELERHVGAEGITVGSAGASRLQQHCRQQGFPIPAG